MKLKLFCLSVLIICFAGISISVKAQLVPGYVSTAVGKAALPPDAKGRWEIKGIVNFYKKNGEQLRAEGWMDVEGGVLKGDLPLSIVDGGEIKGSTARVEMTLSEPFKIGLRHDVNLKPWADDTMKYAKFKNIPMAPYTSGKVIWDGEETDVSVFLGYEQLKVGIRKRPPTPPVATNAGTFLDDAIIKAGTKWTDKGGWYVTATVTIKKRDNSERFKAVGRVVDSGVKVGGFSLTGDLPMTINGLGDAGNSLDFSIRQDGQIQMRRLIAGKPFLGRPATTFKGVVNENHVFAEGVWNGGEILVRVELASEFRKSQPAPIPSAQKETAEQIIAKTPGLIAANTVLVINKRYWSPNKKHFLVFQGDGNLVIYRTSSTGPDAIWNTGTNKPTVLAPFPGAKAVFQKDGNLVVYSSNNKRVWDSVSDLKKRNEKGWSEYLDFSIGIDSEGATPYSKTVWLSMQNDGNLVVYRGTNPPEGFAFWHSQ